MSKNNKVFSKTRAVKKRYKKNFTSDRKLKESPTIPNNHYQSDDDDDDSWDGWSCDDSWISDEFFRPYRCVCIVNEGHKDRDDPNVFQQQFHQRKQARKTCIRWNRMLSDWNDSDPDHNFY